MVETRGGRKMKFVHIADVHFDAPFSVLQTRNLSNQRRLEQREAFRKVIEYIKNNNIPYLFICGDLYEQEYIKNSTIEYINKLFEEIPDTKIFIVPGNHDPYIKNSYYKTYNFARNVKIFTETPEIVEDENIDIYGYGFEDFYMHSVGIENIKIQNKNKINILLTHGDLDGVKNNSERYNSISKTKLKGLEFNYVALGHIHKKTIDENIVYPGSLISLGFDELGEHGMIVGEINEETKEIKLNFIPIDSKEYIEENIDVSDIYSKEELIEKINEKYFPENKYIKIILTGSRKSDIETLDMLKYLSNINIIKIKDMTKLEIDLENISKQNNLKGIFVKKLLEKIEAEPENKEKIQKAMEIGLSAFN